MEDIMGKLNEILSTPEGQAQLNNIKNMLSSSQAAPTNQAAQQTGGGFDISSLSSMLSGMMTNQSQPPPQQAPPQNAGGLDMSAISSLLSGLSNKSQPEAPPQQNAGSGFDLGALATLLGGSGGIGGAASAPSMPNIDMGTILKLQQVFSAMNQNDKTTNLLMALKPHFGPERQTKVDQAISMMRLMNMLPMIKESGLFAGL